MTKYVKITNFSSFFSIFDQKLACQVDGEIRGNLILRFPAQLSNQLTEQLDILIKDKENET